jgi:hypothetical protein
LNLPPFAELVIGDLGDTVPAFLARVSPDAPIGFVAVDVDPPIAAFRLSSGTNACRLIVVLILLIEI